MRPTRKLVSSTHPSLHLLHPTPESFIWNTLIRAHAQQHLSPLSVYTRMLNHSVNPDFRTFPFLLQSFSTPSQLQPAQQIHAHILHTGFASDLFVQTSLINAYSICNNITLADQVFDEIPQPDLPSWNSIIFANAKAGKIVTARFLFDIMPEKNVVSWSCMIDGYVKCGECKEAIKLFREMQVNIRPNEFTISSVLSACGRLGALEHGKWVHAYIDKCGMPVDVVVGTSLIDMYAKCGSIERARMVFKDLGVNKDVMAWSAMISALAMHGFSEESLGLFNEMQGYGVAPNAVTILGVLCACVHGGLVDEGIRCFERMRQDFGVTPLIQHYGCVVDLYGRAGLIEKAWGVVKSMPMKPDVLIWGALLSGSRMHGSIETCEFALKELIELEPDNSGAYILLSNVYAKMNRREDVKHIRRVMELKGTKKMPGCSLVEVEGNVHEFFVGDESHPETQGIYLMLEEIMKRLKEEGYIADINEVLLDLDDEGKELFPISS